MISTGSFRPNCYFLLCQLKRILPINWSKRAQIQHLMHRLTVQKCGLQGGTLLSCFTWKLVHKNFSHSWSWENSAYRDSILSQICFASTTILPQRLSFYFKERWGGRACSHLFDAVHHKTKTECRTNPFRHALMPALKITRTLGSVLTNWLVEGSKPTEQMIG